MNSWQKKHPQSGVTLMAVLFIIALMSAAVGVIYSVTSTEARFMEHSTDRAIAIAYVDGGIQNLFDQWRLAASSTTTGLWSMNRNRTPGARSAASSETTRPTVVKP